MNQKIYITWKKLTCQKFKENKKKKAIDKDELKKITMRKILRIENEKKIIRKHYYCQTCKKMKWDKKK